MEEDDGRNDLSFREQCTVVGVCGGFVVVLSGICWLLISQDGLQTMFASVAKEFRDGHWLTGVGLSFTLVWGIVLYPVGVVLSVMGVYQGAQGRRTGLTAWVLKACDQEEVRRQVEEENLRGPPLPSLHGDGIPNVYVPPLIGYGCLAAIVLGFVVIFVLGYIAATAERPG